jgi:hypothetical protein
MQVIAGDCAIWTRQGAQKSLKYGKFRVLFVV